MTFDSQTASAMLGQANQDDPYSDQQLEAVRGSNERLVESLQSISQRLKENPQEAECAVPFLIKALHDRKLGDQQFVETIEAAGEAAVIPCLDQLGDREGAMLAVIGLAALYPTGREAMEQRLASPDAAVRRDVVQVFQRLDKRKFQNDSLTSLTSLTLRLKDDRPELRAEAACAMITLAANEQDDAWAQLIDDFSSLKLPQKSSLLSALRHAREPSLQSLRKLLELALQDDELSLQTEAAVIGQERHLCSAEQCVEVLRKSIGSSLSSRHKKEALQALGRLEAEAKAALPELMEFVQTEEGSLVDEALLAILQIDEAQAEPLLPKYENLIEGTTRYSTRRHDLAMVLRTRPEMLVRLLPSLSRAVERQDDRLAFMISITILHLTPRLEDSAPPRAELNRAIGVIKAYFRGERAAYVADADLIWLSQDRYWNVEQLVLPALQVEGEPRERHQREAIELLGMRGSLANSMLPELKRLLTESMDAGVVEALQRSIAQIEGGR